MGAPDKTGFGVQMLIISGVNTNYCVDSTIREGYFYDFDMVSFSSDFEAARPCL